MDYMSLVGRRESLSLGFGGAAAEKAAQKAAADAAAKAAEKAAADAAAKAAQKAAGDAAEKAAQKAAADAAEKAAADAAQKAAADAAQKAAADAAEKAAADAASKAAGDAASKAAGDAAEKAAADAAEKAAKDAAEKAAKDASEKAAKDAGEKASKDAAEQAGKKSDFASRAAKFAKDNPLLILGGLGIAGATALALTNANTIEGKQVGITKVEKAGGGGFLGVGGNKKLLDITYSEAVDIGMHDSIVIEGSKTTPSIDGSYNPKKIHNSTKIQIETSEETTGLDAGGTITVHTSVESQLLKMATDTGETLGGAAAGAAGGAASGALGGLANALGIDPDVLKKGLIGFGVVVAIIVIIMIVMKMRKR